MSGGFGRDTGAVLIEGFTVKCNRFLPIATYGDVVFLVVLGSQWKELFQGVFFACPLFSVDIFRFRKTLSLWLHLLKIEASMLLKRSLI